MTNSDYLRAALSVGIVLLAFSDAFPEGQGSASSDKTLTNVVSTNRPTLGQDGAEPDNPHQEPQGQKQIELARQYVIGGDDGRAIEILRGLLRKGPSNREAKLELALVLGYREDYKHSDGVYHELLRQNRDDEAASLGLIRNLLRERRNREARLELEQALGRHPNSILLQEYADNPALYRKTTAGKEERPGTSLVQVGETFFSDSAGNRSVQSTQAVQYQINRFVANQLRLKELSLWNGTAPRANVLTGSEGLQFRLTRFLGLLAQGGVVRYADQSTRSIYSGSVELNPYSHLDLLGGFSRNPISPTFDSAQFDLRAEGWHARLNWHPAFIRIQGSFSRENYSDGNRAEREQGEIIHWSRGSHLALGLGYEFAHEHFLLDLHHGYFSPDQYRRHLAEAGIRFRVGRVFRAESLGRGGVESVSAGDWTPAGELLLRNKFFIKQWRLGLDYSRMEIAQSTGAFRANSGSITLGYEF